ncbi:hypothetical protein [Fluviibacter phosphoraccumulans]|uniref:hypothetical protein n=1 Tax=Fluviibacter phosphoraccumulans TaxID=1751046 RepID=UPI0010B60628|nr:hypothetical protein [Fluviibacter phosphoraccumulans]BCA65813.1 hypothetical protein SHINM1_014150 [Fluviibacter phosphoraccumulans]
MINLIVFALMVAFLAGGALWLARNTERHNRERREAPKKRQQERQAVLRRKLKIGREASKTTAS